MADKLPDDFVILSQGETKTENQLGNLSLYRHPFDDPKFLDTVNGIAPGYKDRIIGAARPGLSNNPDELERWEYEQIESRKKRISYESDFGYALRVLYEETFSVNQFPQEPFKYSNGLTVGGLISHFHPWSTVNGVGLETAAEWDLKGDNLSVILGNEENIHRREQIFELSERITFPGDAMGHYLRMNAPLKARFIRDPQGGKYRGDIDTYGIRLIKLVKTVRQLTEDVKDEKIGEILGINKENFNKHGLKKLDAIRMLWGHFSGRLINDDGTYKQEDMEGVKAGFEELLYIRTHPEFQFLYEYASASGPLNESQL